MRWREYMLRVGEQPAELLIEERNPPSVEDKKAVGSRRAAWRVDTSVEQKENTEGIGEQASKLDGGCAAQAPEWNDFDELIPKWLNFVKEVVDSEGVPLARRVFIMDDCDELITEWLNRIVGTVDSEDLPLDISGETLLQNKIMRVIKKNQVKKYLEMLAEIAELNAAYDKFYEQFGARLKLGISEDSTVGVKIAELLRFGTFKSGDEQINFEGYADRMKEGQNDVYCIAGESTAMVSSSPFLENLRNKGYEVPYMAEPVDEYAVPFEENLCKKGLEALHVADPMDEYAVHRPKEFDGKMLKFTREEGLDLGDEDEKKTLEELKAEFKSLTKLTKEVCGDKVEEAIVDDRTVDFLRVITTSGHGVYVDMERVMKAQVPLDSGSQRMHFASGSQQEGEKERREDQEEKKEEEGQEERQEGERRKNEEGKEAEEGGSEQVKKDVTGWTEVTRKKRRNMVQIFVKMNESKVVPMEVSLKDDKVEDVMRQIQKDEGRVRNFVRESAKDKRKAEELRSH